MILDSLVGYFLGLFTSAMLVVFQAIVQSLGTIREGRQARGMGAGFYASLSLAISGNVLFALILQTLLETSLLKSPAKTMSEGSGGSTDHSVVLLDKVY